MTQSQLIHSFPKNSEEEIRLSLREYKERHYVDLRLWFQPADGGEYRPSHKGLTLAVEYLPELQNGLQRVAKAASEMPLHSTSKSVK